MSDQGSALDSGRHIRGIAAAYLGAVLIGVAGILLSVLIFVQTAHNLGPFPLPKASPALPHSGGSPAKAPAPSVAPVQGPNRSTGSAGPAGGGTAAKYPPGEPPGDIEDERAGARPAAGPVLPVPLPSVTTPVLPSVP